MTTCQAMAGSLQNKKNNKFMGVDFLLYILNKCFGGYFYSISIFSIFIILSIVSLTKAIFLWINPSIFNSELIKMFFQLAIFLFIPLFVFLISKKYKYDQISKNTLRIKGINFGLCVCFVVILLVILAVLFTYILIFPK